MPILGTVTEYGRHVLATMTGAGAYTTQLYFGFGPNGAGQAYPPTIDDSLNSISDELTGGDVERWPVTVAAYGTTGITISVSSYPVVAGLNGTTWCQMGIFDELTGGNMLYVGYHSVSPGSATTDRQFATGDTWSIPIDFVFQADT